MQLVPGPMASCSALPTLFVPWDRTEERVPLSAFQCLLKVEHFGAVATSPVNPKYQASSPDKSQVTPSSGDQYVLPYGGAELA